MTVLEQLTDEEKLTLDIAGRTYIYESSRDQAARDELGISAQRFYQRLNVLTQRQVAIAYAPATCRRIRERLDRGRRRRHTAF